MTNQVRNFLRTWSHLLKKSLMENFIFRAVTLLLTYNLHVSTENVPITLEKLVTSNSIESNICVWDFKNQIMRLNAEIETLKTFLEQIFIVKKCLEERHQSVGDCNCIEYPKDEIKYLRAENQMKIAILIKVMSEK